MQPSPSFGSEGSASDILRQTEAHYERAIQALGALIQRIESGDLGARTEVQQTATDVRKAMQTFFDERKKIEDQLRRDTGVVHAVALDFNAARDEIGRRLDRLRAARAAE
ncbi:hypothetical protein [Roseitranquillus sediminis]|uniref:hypothetical protein n=1 Tax=Roseitranquillus sediminis TaxID=2809051 RepID=UPI001D0C6444|nr:hypothetical protein [Roseitranquillus sediminis]MBM9595216.1 hypothetical protein [Roseitranquillus sediminis]